MKKLIIVFFAVFTVLTMSTVTFAETSTAADNKSKCIVYDECDKLTDSQEETVNEILKDTYDATKLNICVLISDNVGNNKSDSAVVDYADIYYENIFGIDTDGILFLINEDTYYDIISTSGIAIRYFTDDRIDDMIDDFSDTYAAIKNGNYEKACTAFADYVNYYYKKGIPSNQYNEDEYGNKDYNEEVTFIEKMFVTLPFGLFAAAILVLISIFTIKARYRPKKVGNAANYVDKNTINYTQSTDTFIREYTTKVKIESSSSGGGGGRSSTHHSSSGGSHGGGGHHR